MVVLLLQHKDVVKPVFVHDRSAPEELAALLHSLFPRLRGHGDIVGIRHSRQSHFNNLALVCATPTKFTDRVYHVVTDDEKLMAGGSGAAGAAELPLASVHIGHSHLFIDVYRQDVDVLRRFNAATGLCEVPLPKLWDVFRGRISSGEQFVSKQVYFDCVDELLKSQNATSPKWTDKVLVSRVFDAVFEAFDHDHSGVCVCVCVRACVFMGWLGCWFCCSLCFCCLLCCVYCAACAVASAVCAAACAADVAAVVAAADSTASAAAAAASVLGVLRLVLAWSSPHCHCARRPRA
jgi:hypothetical protein